MAAGLGLAAKRPLLDWPGHNVLSGLATRCRCTPSLRLGPSPAPTPTAVQGGSRRVWRLPLFLPTFRRQVLRVAFFSAPGLRAWSCPAAVPKRWPSCRVRASLSCCTDSSPAWCRCLRADNGLTRASRRGLLRVAYAAGCDESETAYRGEVGGQRRRSICARETESYCSVSLPQMFRRH